MGCWCWISAQAHYLLNVRRCKEQDTLLLFNGRDGEWLAEITHAGKKRCEVVLKHSTPLAERRCRIYGWYSLPVKYGRIDYMVEKATELGASRLLPVRTRRTDCFTRQWRAALCPCNRGGRAERAAGGAGGG